MNSNTYYTNDFTWQKHFCILIIEMKLFYLMNRNIMRNSYIKKKLYQYM